MVITGAILIQISQKNQALSLLDRIKLIELDETTVGGGKLDTNLMELDQNYLSAYER